MCYTLEGWYISPNKFWERRCFWWAKCFGRDCSNLPHTHQHTHTRTAILTGLSNMWGMGAPHLGVAPSPSRLVLPPPLQTLLFPPGKIFFARFACNIPVLVRAVRVPVSWRSGGWLAQRWTAIFTILFSFLPPCHNLFSYKECSDEKTYLAKGGLTHVEVEPILWLRTKQIMA